VATRNVGERVPRVEFRGELLLLGGRPQPADVARLLRTPLRARRVLLERRDACEQRALHLGLLQHRGRCKGLARSRVDTPHERLQNEVRSLLSHGAHCPPAICAPGRRKSRVFARKLQSRHEPHYRSHPMRSFIVFFGLILAGFAVIALLAYPAWLAVAPLLDEPRFHRIANRLGMLALVAGFVFVARRMGLADRASLGYGLPRREFLRELGIGLALGVVLMLPVAALMFAFDLRSAKEGLALDAGTFARLALPGLVSGLAVAFIEETFLRGAMFTGIARESGTRAAIVLTSLVYAAVHFVGRYRIPVEELGWESGIAHVAGTLRSFAEPLAIADAFLCLFAVGVLLGIVRALTGNIAACIGLHAGWVWIITFVRETSAPDRGAPLGFLVSEFDGFVGWGVLAWTILIGAVIVRFYQRPLRQS